MTQLENTAKQVVDLLLDAGKTISLAESCTGGMIASALVSCAGVSDALLEGCVCYSNEAKVRTLHVLTQTLRDHGAVSGECALEMVHGICDYTGSDCGIAVTGIAGPGGGTKDKPVGLVFIAVKANAQVCVQRHVFDGDRAQVRMQSAIQALTMLRQMIE